MTQDVYRYTFSNDVPTEEVEATLLLAVLAAESLHGEAQVLLDAAHFFDPERRACAIGAGTAVGRDVNRLFAGYLRHEFGPDAFTAERVGSGQTDLDIRARAPAAAGAT
jgi:hypothetical protein